MVTIGSLWLPIVLSAVLVFVVSSILHMVLKYHRADYSKLPNEEGVLNALRGAAPGYYPFPHCADPKDMGSPEMVAKYQSGPVGMVTVTPSGPPNLGKFLGLWFLYCALVSFFAAYLASRTFPVGHDYLAVFRFVGTTTFLAFGVANISDSIWKGQPWSNTLRAVADGLLYALVTAGTFGWLWPR